jgi:antitoxin (DNA-binding transcriptional repressor) of toxin-antitoxin stability system
MVDAAASGDVVRITRNGKAVAELRPPAEDEFEYWKGVKPLNIGKGGISRLLLDERRRSR